MCGCQGTNPDSSQSFVDPVPSSRIDTVHSRPLDPPYTLAILPLDNLTPNASLYWLGKSLSEMLVNDLAKKPSLFVIAREAMGPVLREQWLQQRGFSSSVPAIDLGHIQGVRYVVSGGFHQQEGNLRIDLQIIDVETGVVVRSLSAQGQQSDISRIEQDLVVQMFNTFNPPLDSSGNFFSNQVEKENPKHDIAEDLQEKDRLHLGSAGSFGIHSIPQMDVQLALEQMTQYRLDAYQAAETFWKKGWSAEMGKPLYRVWQSSDNAQESLSILSLPISLFIQRDKIADVVKNRRTGGISSFVNLERDGFSKSLHDETGASRLFFEQVGQPRRLFVRALNEKDELVAVYSKWSWQTPEILQYSSLERLHFPMWPQPFISGVAEFPGLWIERGEQHISFDVVVVPIPDEQRTIVLEPIVFSYIEDSEGLVGNPDDMEFLLPLKNVIELNWNPPISEAMPVQGYLPANKQTVMALLNLQAGKIMNVQFQKVPHDTLFYRSLEELKVSLIGYCVDCQNSEKSSSGPGFQTIRLQLTLGKDLHALRFGS